MSTKFSFTMVTLLMLISMTGCGANSAKNSLSGTPTDNESNENYVMLPYLSGKMSNITLDATADGTTQQLKKGEVMAFGLESNPSTGYSWFATISNPTVLVQMGEPQYQEPAGSSTTPIVGAAGTETFYFQAVETGTTALTLEYKRSFESNVAPEKTISLTVEVK
jgi:inhibitor of cysteine peptidase